MAVKTRLEILCELIDKRLYMVNMPYALKKKTSVIFIH